MTFIDDFVRVWVDMIDKPIIINKKQGFVLNNGTTILLELSKMVIWNAVTGSKGRSIEEMATSHLFNCLKMMYNHLAIIVGVPRIMFSKEHPQLYEYWKKDPKSMIKWMKIFIVEIDDRKDLRGPSNTAYTFIKEMLKGRDKKGDFTNIKFERVANVKIGEKQSKETS